MRKRIVRLLSNALRNRSFFTNVPSGLISEVPVQSLKYKDASTQKAPTTLYPFLSNSTGSVVRVEIKSIPIFSEVTQSKINNDELMVDASRLSSSLNTLISTIQSVAEVEQNLTVSLKTALLSVRPLIMKLHGLGLSISNIQNLLCGELGVLIDERELCEYLYGGDVGSDINVEQILHEIKR